MGECHSPLLPVKWDCKAEYNGCPKAVTQNPGYGAPNSDQGLQETTTQTGHAAGSSPQTVLTCQADCATEQVSSHPHGCADAASACTPALLLLPAESGWLLVTQQPIILRLLPFTAGPVPFPC